MTKHVHADLMLQYAQESMTNDEAWKNWEQRSGDKWLSCCVTPCWYEDVLFRRKPKTININGFEVPESLRGAPELGSFYFIVLLHNDEPVGEYMWTASYIDRALFKSGLAHATREAAMIHAKSLLSFTKLD